MAMAYAQARMTNPEAPPLILARMANPFPKSPFGGFEQETKRALGTPVHNHAPELARVLEAWEKHHRKWLPQPRANCEYPFALEAVSGISCSAAALEQFVVLLTPESIGLDERVAITFGFMAGIFVSALVNNGSEDSYILDTRSLGAALHHVGYANRKNILVIGDTGWCIGDSMESGTITVTENAGIFTGCGMSGGKIIVQGNCDANAGQEMTDGEIHIHGECAGVGALVNGGRIFVRGVLVYPASESIPDPEPEARLE